MHGDTANTIRINLNGMKHHLSHFYTILESNMQQFMLNFGDASFDAICLQDVAIAAAKGLMHMGSYYMSSDGSTSIQPAATSASTAGSSSSSSSRHDRLSSSQYRVINRARISQV